MKNLFLLLFLFWTITATAQKQSYDLLAYTLPKGYTWKKETGNNFLSYSYINNTKKTWCQLIVYKSTASKGAIETDFESEWTELNAKQQAVTAGPEKSEVRESDGWTIMAGAGKASFDGNEMMILHTVMSGYNACVSVVAKTNSTDYLQTIERFTASISLKKPGKRPAGNNPIVTTSGAYQFASTNWDDGWITTAQDNWAEVVKGNLRVLVHYPNQQADAYNSVLREGLQNAWNILIAPRYSNIHNYQLKPIQSYESISFAEADATDITTGGPIHIVLFKKHYSNGNGRYLEFVTPDKQSFEHEFGAYHNDEFGWDKLSAMQYRNKFAVGANDLTGKWSASDYASLTYYYTNGGGYAGATATSVAHEFTFFNSSQYQSDHAGASGAVGNQKFSRQVYKGKYTVTNWEMELTNRFQGASEKYSCYFEAIKGGRILIMTDKQNTVYSLIKR